MSLATLLLSQGQDVRLNFAGATIMLFSFTLVIGLNVFCMYRILRGEKLKDDR